VKAPVGAFATGNTYVIKTYKYTDSHKSDHKNGFSTRKNIGLHSFAGGIGLIAEERQLQRGTMPGYF